MGKGTGITQMPITDYQKGILKLIAGNRSVESHVAGGLVLNAAVDSLRFSHDVDIFHEAAEEVARSRSLLKKHGMKNCESFWTLARRDEEVGRDQRLRSNAARTQKGRSPQGHPLFPPAKPLTQ